MKYPGDCMRKSPLHYPGGKTRAISYLANSIPPPEKEPIICSPFLGGGSLELFLVQRGYDVWGYDAFAPLVNFWQQALKDARGLADMVARDYPPDSLGRDEFYQMQRQIMGVEDSQRQAAMYFVINRASFSGVTLSGGMSPGHERFNWNAIERLRRFTPNIHPPLDPNRGAIRVGLADFHSSIPQHPAAFLYLDPPYAIAPTLYGQRGGMHNNFDHAGLAGLLRGRDRWVLSYNDCDLIRDLYAGCSFTKAEWAYGISNGKVGSEVIIAPTTQQNVTEQR